MGRSRRIGSFLSKFLVCCRKPKVSQSPPPTRPDFDNLFNKDLIVSDAVPVHDAALKYFDAQQDEEPTISFEPPTGYGTVELANHALQPEQDGCDDNSDEAEEVKGLLCIKDEEDVTDGEYVQNQLVEDDALEEVLEEGNQEGSILDLVQEIGNNIIQFGEHARKPGDGGSVEDGEEPEAEVEQTSVSAIESFHGGGYAEAEEEQVLEDVLEEGDEAAGVCELVKVCGDEECFSVGRDSKAGEEEEAVEDVTQKVQEDVKDDELIKVNGLEDPLVRDDDLEDEDAKEMSEEGEMGVKGGESVEDCLAGGFDSKDELISLTDWGTFEEEENHLTDLGYSEDKEYSLAEDVSKVGVGDAEGCEPVVLVREKSAVEWGDFEHLEGDAIEQSEEISKDDESVDLCNGDDGVLADRGDAIDAGGGGYKEEEPKEEAHHKVAEDIPKLKELEVFVGGLSCDSSEADLVKVLDVKMLDQTVFFMDPMTKNNKGFAFLQTEADLGKVFNETIFFVEPTTKNNNGSTFLQSPNDDQASIGLSKLKDPLVNGMPYGVAPSQDCEHHEEIMDAKKNEGSLGCIRVPGWETSVLQPGSFYITENVASTESYCPPHMVAGGDIHGSYAMQGGTGMMECFQGQLFMSFAPTLVDHGAISGSYQLAQTDTGGEVNWSSQAVPGAIGMVPPLCWLLSAATVF